MYYFNIILPKYDPRTPEEDPIPKYIKHFQEGLNSKIKEEGPNCSIITKSTEAYEIRMGNKPRAINLRCTLNNFGHGVKQYFESFYGILLPKIYLSRVLESYPEKKRAYAEAFQSSQGAPNINLFTQPIPSTSNITQNVPQMPIIQTKELPCVPPKINRRRKTVTFAEQIVKPLPDLRSIIKEKATVEIIPKQNKDDSKFQKFDELFKLMFEHKQVEYSKEVCKVILKFKKGCKEIDTFTKRIESLVIGIKETKVAEKEEKIEVTYIFENVYIAKCFQEKILKYDYKKLETFKLKDLSIELIDPTLQKINEIINF